MKLKDLATVVRSKNAGPYELTFDVIFRTPEIFRAAQAREVINPVLLKKLYNVADDEILGITWFAQANAVKATIKRLVSAGAVGETDVYGAQQHMPLADADIPWEE